MKDRTSKGVPIQRQLMRAMLLTSGLALGLTCTAFFIYEYVTFRQTLKSQLMTLAEIIAANSTAALAFDSAVDAEETLVALRTNRHIVAACLYDKKGKLFAHYPEAMSARQFPSGPGAHAYAFKNGYLEGFQPVVQGRTQLGSLYLKSDMGAMYERFIRYSLIVGLVIGISLWFVFLLSRRFQRTISQPILALAQTATLVSQEHTYTVRATKYQEDEVGLLTDAFNQMLSQIEGQNTEIRLWTHQLEERIRERTQELEQTNAAMTMVNAKLLKSNRDLEQFAYVASHDLREPLRKIQLFSQLAESKADDPVLIRQYNGKIFASAERMAALIKSVLNYSRLSNANDPFYPVDLQEVMEQVKTDFELVIQEKKAHITATDLPVIPGIPLQLNQLLSNLIGNALKFCNQSPRITVTATVMTGSAMELSVELPTRKNYVQLAVADNGIGFDAQYAEKIFTIFQRLHPQKDFQGTGIGLALCKKIVENHGGKITVTSQVGKGTSFFVYLPMDVPDSSTHSLHERLQTEGGDKAVL
ncbi:ATP-binding protein [Spirosoma utsteinense]|uniref:histidine kinase n=1 Tax=Spirosoma utsteinense TaxID=2585773 RepID=A0ABR6W6F1_9BACT|nr:ATP-binding protein [Spirosoma utsteinense]MBC3787912.1 signal transduction histidine kinase [Spirosoma utsteinense]MBC3792166.1 signal transduction histidine kinase [Spirosoma utsteinense]